MGTYLDISLNRMSLWDYQETINFNGIYDVGKKWRNILPVLATQIFNDKYICQKIVTYSDKIPYSLELAPTNTRIDPIKRPLE